MEIQKLAKEIGISKIGFTTADDFDYLEKTLRAGVKEGRTTGFEHKSSKNVSNLSCPWHLPRPSFQ